jgi:proteasome lid subunit RPN8/RPN11
MKAHARQTYPEECCGILLGTIEGDRKSVHDALAIGNSSEQLRTRRFIITPDDYRNAEALASRKGLDVLGFYHSHPDHPAHPSQFDLEHAFPWWSYVIIGVEDGNPSAMSSWLLLEDRSRFEEEMFEISNVK